MTALIKSNNDVFRRVPAVLGRTVFNEIFNDLFQDPMPYVHNSTRGYPLTDIYQEENGNQVIEAALAGFSKEELIIETKENTITIGCETASEDNNRRIAKRSFKKTFVDYHNKLDFKKSEASFENGLLRIVIPQLAEKKTSFIKIK